MIYEEMLALVRCPHCAPSGGGVLTQDKADWLSCGDCGRHYPIVQDIPVLLPEEGDKWKGVELSDLAVIESHNRFVSA